MNATFEMLSLSVLGALIGLMAGANELSIQQRADEIEWQTLAEPEGAVVAQLWADPGNGDRGRLMRWPAKSQLDHQVQSRDTHFVVLAGTFVVTVAGSAHEIGPGGFAEVPRGVSHSIGCEASGACMFLMHIGGK